MDVLTFIEHMGWHITDIQKDMLLALQEGKNLTALYPQKAVGRSFIRLRYDEYRKTVLRWTPRTMEAQVFGGPTLDEMAQIEVELNRCQTVLRRAAEVIRLMECKGITDDELIDFKGLLKSVTQLCRNSGNKGVTNDK